MLYIYNSIIVKLNCEDYKFLQVKYNCIYGVDL